VIGADGLHSNVRTLAFGPEQRYVKHLGYYVSIFSTDNFLDLDRWGLYYNVPGRLASIYSTRNNEQARVMLGFASEPLDYDHRDLNQQRQILADRFASDGWEVPRLLEAMHSAPDFYFDSTSQVHLDRRTNGRIALVGDAGYCPSPLSGQGTSTAIVGAYLLAGELATTAGDHRPAFASYDVKLQPFIERNQRLATSNAKWFAPRKRSRIWFRNLNLRMLPHLPWRDAVLNHATQAIREAANAITIETYAPMAGQTAGSGSSAAPAQGTTPRRTPSSGRPTANVERLA
jgi:2-polyprenyl-6-methoxyphenol hydroxylase-like FAD-dependent oxidoreductase